MKRAAVIGLGDISATHLAAIAANPAIALCAVCDTDPAKAADAAQLGVPFYTDYRAMVAEQKPDCAHICLPHYLHYPVACDLAGAGVHIFCEKPEAISTEQAAQFCRLEAAHPELQIGICLQNRRNTTVERLHELLQGGQYGAVTGVRGCVFWDRPAGYYAAKPWRGKWATAGSGSMMNQSIHTLDLMYYFGGPLREVKALVGQTLDYGIEVEDTVAARFTFENGARGFFTATNANYKNEAVQVNVQTEKAEFRIRDNCLYCALENASGPEKEHCLAEDTALPGGKFYYGTSHARLIAEFYRGLETGSRNYITVRQGAYAIGMIGAIRASAEQGRAVPVPAPWCEP